MTDITLQENHIYHNYICTHKNEWYVYVIIYIYICIYIYAYVLYTGTCCITDCISIQYIYISTYTHICSVHSILYTHTHRWGLWSESCLHRNSTRAAWREASQREALRNPWELRAVKLVVSLDWFNGTSSPETMVFTIKYGGFRLNGEDFPVKTTIQS